MTAADVERTQAEVETAFHSKDMGSGDDDDLADEQHAATCTSLTVSIQQLSMS